MLAGERRCTVQWNERQLSDLVCERLGPWFAIEREVPGDYCGGGRLRLDAMLRPHDTSDWADDDLAFGVEFKRPLPADTKSWAGRLAQAVDYTHTDWDGYGRVRIFICDGSEHAPRDEFQRDQMLFRNMLWQLGVGRLVFSEHRGLSLFGGHLDRLWSERDGVNHARIWSLKAKRGSRY